MKRGAEDWLLTNLSEFQDYVLSAETTAAGKGILQRIDPRVKVVGILALIISAVAVRKLSVIIGILAVSTAMGMASRIQLRQIARWVWLPVVLFSGAIALPAIFLTPGRNIGFHITFQGIRSAAFLLLRAETAATLSGLLTLTTPWPRLLKALRVLGVPTVFVAILASTQRYMFLLLQTAAEMAEARRSRTVGIYSAGDKRRIAGSSVGVLLSKSLQISTDVHQAMIARGFRGNFYLLENSRLKITDWFWLSGFALISLSAVYVGR
jgi:cobalt/nickel transport system permease protein